MLDSGKKFLAGSDLLIERAVPMAAGAGVNFLSSKFNLNLGVLANSLLSAGVGAITFASMKSVSTSMRDIIEEEENIEGKGDVQIALIGSGAILGLIGYGLAVGFNKLTKASKFSTPAPPVKYLG